MFGTTLLTWDFASVARIWVASPPMDSLPTDLVALAHAYPYPADRVWLRANMIASLDGAAWFGDRVEALGSAADQRLLVALRAMADVVIVGAGTIRAEGYGPLSAEPDWPSVRAGRPPVPPLAIVSRRLDLDLDGPIFTKATSRTILLTTEAAPRDRLHQAERHAEVIVAGRDGLDWRTAVSELAARGHRRLLSEGGPTVLARAAQSEVLDELCLTVSPMLAAGAAARILDGPALPAPERFRLRALHADDDFLFLRYVRDGGAAGATG
jgi:riboflavin biosynthesis pyrimidine reductase